MNGIKRWADAEARAEMKRHEERRLREEADKLLIDRLKFNGPPHCNETHPLVVGVALARIIELLKERR